MAEKQVFSQKTRTQTSHPHRIIWYIGRAQLMARTYRMSRYRTEVQVPLEEIQNNIFVLGSVLATEPEKKENYE